MKKIIALLLVIVMMMGLATVASADTTQAALDTSTWTSEQITIEIFKEYTVTGQIGSDPIIVPDETLTFTSTPDGANPDTSHNLTVADLVTWATGESAMKDVDGKKTGKMVVTIPSYSQVGVYNYVITENSGNAQAAVYDTNSIGIQVLVDYDYTENCLVAHPSMTTPKAAESTDKDNTFDNTYALGQLTVEKTVTGNLGAKDVEFEMNVTFTSKAPVKSDITIIDGTNDQTNVSDTIVDHNSDWTLKGEEGNQYYEAVATIYVEHGETVTFNNIPVGVSYTVWENNKYQADDPNKSDPEKGYAVSYTNETGTISATASAATVTNDKDVDVDTGIAMDSVPFIVMAVVAVLGVAAITFKKRVQE